MVAGGLVGAAADLLGGCGCVTSFGVKDHVSVLCRTVVSASVTVVDLPGGIAALLPHPSHTHLVSGAASGKTLDPFGRTMAAS
jgi:hypothetical protein